MDCRISGCKYAQALMLPHQHQHITRFLASFLLEVREVLFHLTAGSGEDVAGCLRWEKKKKKKRQVAGKSGIIGIPNRKSSTDPHTTVVYVRLNCWQECDAFYLDLCLLHLFTLTDVLVHFLMWDWSAGKKALCTTQDLCFFHPLPLTDVLAHFLPLWCSFPSISTS